MLVKLGRGLPLYRIHPTNPAVSAGASSFTVESKLEELQPEAAAGWYPLEQCRQVIDVVVDKSSQPSATQ